ncbi:hypothetical protein KZZ52_43530 [Dactylosporangium sp. AC04546]|uniref:hypothetical protein n=1 Tax=Dactylosporangium sp. AC04546 TaxID=2862460 RepID=UPI001EE1154E|nr:hypothetical protein [Dactylosporangium sp. AC04546]WVK80786.1 hypothetical protein KZZ52_43530 [Dactylosporangium sp. AC04546]
MLNVHDATELARRAADLLPEPPRAGDADGYRAWRDLVLSTAARIAAVADLRGLDIPASHAGLSRYSRVTWQTLLALAATARPSQHQPACVHALTLLSPRRPAIGRRAPRRPGAVRRTPPVAVELTPTSVAARRTD